LHCPPRGSGFEAKAFAALWNNREELRIEEVWRCHAARIDGYLKTVGDEIVLVEIKETLSWGSTEAAGFQFLSGRKLLRLDTARKGIIVFGRIARQWEQTRPYGGWGQLALEADALRPNLEMGALQVVSRNRVCTWPAP
jgi:hypothetical protein